MNKIVFKSIQQLYLFSCFLKFLDYTKFYFNFSVDKNLNFEIKTKGLLKKEFKNIMNSIFNSWGHMNVNINGCNYYNNQWNPITDKKGIIFFKSGERCSAIPAFKKAARDILSTSPAFICHSEYDIKKFSALSSIKEVTDIEKGIVHLVLAVNKIPEFCTVYSCQGHRFGIPLMTPFVSFISISDDKVLKFAELLDKNSDKFFHKWFIDGTVINCCPLYSPYILWTLSIKDFFFLRKRLFKDFDLIDEILSLLP